MYKNKIENVNEYNIEILAKHENKMEDAPIKKLNTRGMMNVEGI
jgi:hypothetical protein